jgi:hypothetical protein
MPAIWANSLAVWNLPSNKAVSIAAREGSLTREAIMATFDLVLMARLSPFVIHTSMKVEIFIFYNREVDLNRRRRDNEPNKSDE